VGELDAIDDDLSTGDHVSIYLGYGVDLISGGWEDDRVNDGAKQVK
jgi:hypothetical protein